MIIHFSINKVFSIKFSINFPLFCLFSFSYLTFLLNFHLLLSFLSSSSLLYPPPLFSVCLFFTALFFYIYLSLHLRLHFFTLHLFPALFCLPALHSLCLLLSSLLLALSPPFCPPAFFRLICFSCSISPLTPFPLFKPPQILLSPPSPYLDSSPSCIPLLCFLLSLSSSSSPVFLAFSFSVPVLLSFDAGS